MSRSTRLLVLHGLVYELEKGRLFRDLNVTRESHKNLRLEEKWSADIQEIKGR